MGTDISWSLYRETDQYKAYEHFSLTMGIFTMGEKRLDSELSHIFKFHFRSKISPDICGSPAMIIGPYNVQVKWVKWSIYNLQYFQQSRLHFRLKTLFMDCRQSTHQSEYKKKRPPMEVLLLGVYFQICTTKSKGAEVICHNLHIHGKIMNMFCLKKRHFKIVPFS